MRVNKSHFLSEMIKAKQENNLGFYEWLSAILLRAEEV